MTYIHVDIYMYIYIYSYIYTDIWPACTCMKLIFSERQQILSLLAEFKLLETDRFYRGAWTLTFLVSLHSESERGRERAVA